MNYDSDNKDDAVFHEAVNHCVQMSGKVLIWEEEKQGLKPHTTLLYLSFIDAWLFCFSLHMH